MASDVSCSRPSVCFVFLYFNIPRMFKLVLLQVVVLLDINTVFLDTSRSVVSIFLFSCFFWIAKSVPSNGGPQPSCEVAPHQAWVVHAILDSFFQVSESDLGIMPWRRIFFIPFIGIIIFCFILIFRHGYSCFSAGGCVAGHPKRRVVFLTRAPLSWQHKIHIHTHTHTHTHSQTHTHT